VSDATARPGRSHRLRRYDLSMTKAELIEQVKAMTEEEAAEVKLIYAPDWPSRATSIEEIRRRVGTRAMTPDESEKFWQEYGPLMQPPDGEG
jgi:hypothetical protein